MTKEECHEYKFELTFSQYNSEEEISDIILERILDAMIEIAMAEELRMGGGYSKYNWIASIECWVGSFLAYWRNRILCLLGKNRWHKGNAVFVEYGEWTKFAAPKGEVL